MLEELHMAELLCTRLCHDLTGPIGAVNNGAEFLSEEGFNMQNQAVELITSSAFSAVTRLQFYRMAYGKLRDHGEANLEEKKKLAADFFADSKITLDWPDSHTDASGVSVSIKMSRLIFNLLIVSSGALIRGGTIAVRIEQADNNKKQVTITSTGPGLKWDTEMEQIFSGNFDTDKLDARNVQTYITKRFTDEIDGALSCKVDGETLAMQVTQQA